MRSAVRLAALITSTVTGALVAAPPVTTQAATTQAVATPAVTTPAVSQPTTQVALTPAQQEVRRRVNQQDPAVPAAKVDRDGNPDATFLRKHATILDRVKRPAEIAFVGDSITEGWRDSGGKVFAAEFGGDARVANLGVGGDHVQNVLWRIQQGELDGIRPKVVVLLVGTNNIFNWPPDAIARGVAATVDAIRAKQPGAKVLLLGLFPRGELPSNPLREKVRDVNALLAKLDDGGKGVRYLDLGDRFLEPDGTIAKTVFYDYLHPAAAGYQRWADAMRPVLAQMME